MRIAGDTHTHTVACGHALSTFEENINAAREKGHRFICATEHAPAMKNAPPRWYFKTLQQSVPRVWRDIVIIKGVETNILDIEGRLDLEEEMLSSLDWVIASLHAGVIGLPMDPTDATEVWCNVAKNPWVDVIGHVGNPNAQPNDWNRVMEAFREGNKIVELNCSSRTSRPGSETICCKVAALCRDYRVPIVLSSDAHFSACIGEVDWALDLVESLSIPESMVLNSSYERFAQTLYDRRGIILPE